MDHDGSGVDSASDCRIACMFARDMTNVTVMVLHCYQHHTCRMQPLAGRLGCSHRAMQRHQRCSRSPVGAKSRRGLWCKFFLHGASEGASPDMLYSLVAYLAILSRELVGDQARATEPQAKTRQGGSPDFHSEGRHLFGRHHARACEQPMASGSPRAGPQPFWLQRLFDMEASVESLRSSCFGLCRLAR